jgi:hypothetical protein
MEGTCFLKPKATDKEKMKSLPPPEEDVDPDGVQGATIVADSDDENENYRQALAPAPVQAPAPAVPDEVQEPENVTETVEEVIEVKPKKKVIKKKVVE